MSVAEVTLWGTRVGAVQWLADEQVGVFQYSPDFTRSGIELAPITMRLRAAPYRFNELRGSSFHGLPGMLSDSLPDRFGNALIDAALARMGRSPESFSPVERLCYIGTRGMGALEYQPSTPLSSVRNEPVDISYLADLAAKALDVKAEVGGVLSGDNDAADIEHILQVGTSAGGARAKAVLAWNPESGEFRSGQLPAGSDFQHWILKFDGVDTHGPAHVGDTQGYGRIEYAYFLMATQAGIEMAPSRLHEEGGRAHFMTKRFDRVDGDKLHMVTLSGMQHFDYAQAGVHSYEQAVQTLDLIGGPASDKPQLVRRALFNVLARNQDDHTKNISFLMDRSGQWKLSPAYDMSYSYNTAGEWTNAHQMSLNGKTDGFTDDDLMQFAEFAGLKAKAAKSLLHEVRGAIHRWPEFAEQAGVPDRSIVDISRNLRNL